MSLYQAETYVGLEIDSPENWARIGKEIAELPPPAKSDPWLLLRIRGDFRRAGMSLQPAYVRVINAAGEDPRITPGANTSGRYGSSGNEQRC